MNRLLDLAGNVAAMLGILVCVLAGVARLTGSYYVFGYEAVTLFIAGMALMVMACLAKLHNLTRQGIN